MTCVLMICVLMICVLMICVLNSYVPRRLADASDVRRSEHPEPKTDVSNVNIQMKRFDTPVKSDPHPWQYVLILGAARSQYHHTPS